MPTSAGSRRSMPTRASSTETRCRCGDHLALPAAVRIACRSVHGGEMGQGFAWDAVAVGTGPMHGDLVEAVTAQPADSLAVALLALEGPPGVEHELCSPSHVTMVTARVGQRVVQ